ncbi:MAG: Ppx/GppA phosphatase family protein, partial [Acidimicrobiales bacterium]
MAGHPRLSAARCLVGLAGTVTTLSALQHHMAVYDREMVHHSVLTADEISRWYRMLAAEGHSARMARTGMAAGREDVIVGGAMILHAVMERTGMGECLVSEADILDGMVAVLLSEL